MYMYLRIGKCGHVNNHINFLNIKKSSCKEAICKKPVKGDIIYTVGWAKLYIIEVD